MMSLATINYLSEQAAAKAAQDEREPFIPTEQELDRWARTHKLGEIPNLGDYRPAGWKLVEEWTVDSFGGDGDGIVTGVKSLLRDMHEPERKSYGYAILWVAQFCVGVGAFVKDATEQGNLAVVSQIEIDEEE